MYSTTPLPGIYELPLIVIPAIFSKNGRNIKEIIVNLSH